jgi:hypothetical protein
VGIAALVKIVARPVTAELAPMPLRTQLGGAGSSFPTPQLVAASSIVFHLYKNPLFPGSYPHATRQRRENHRPYLSCNQRLFVLEPGVGFQCLVIKECECQIGTTAPSLLSGSSLSPRVIRRHAAALSGHK